MSSKRAAPKQFVIGFINVLQEMYCLGENQFPPVMNPASVNCKKNNFLVTMFYKLGYAVCSQSSIRLIKCDQRGLKSDLTADVKLKGKKKCL